LRNLVKIAKKGYYILAYCIIIIGLLLYNYDIITMIFEEVLL